MAKYRYHKGSQGKVPEEQNAVFVFGSNERGAHGAGAALYAHQHHGAAMGQGFGFMPIGMPTGRIWTPCSFAIPTKDWFMEPLERHDIEHYVHRFLQFTMFARPLPFFVTAVGCGLAGYKPEDIAPMFRVARPSGLKHVVFPEEFAPYMEK